MFENMAVEAFHKLREERGLEQQQGKLLGGFYAHEAIELCKKKKRKDSSKLGM